MPKLKAIPKSTTADVVLTSYHKKDIDYAIDAFRQIIEVKSHYRMGDPETRRVKSSEEIHGCRIDELNRKAFTVTGPAADLPKLVDIVLPEGVYFQLIYQNSEDYLKKISSNRKLKNK